MKRVVLTFFCLSFLLSAKSQIRMQFDSTSLKNKALIEKPNELLNDIHLFANIRFASNNNFTNGDFVSSEFKTNELRMELVGKVTDKILFRFRDSYTASSDVNVSDGLRYSVNLAYLEYQANPRIAVTIGKMISERGGYELEINPVLMYTYNDLIKYGDFFLSGVKASYKVSQAHKLSLQINNSHSRPFNALYNNTPGVEASKAPIGGTLSWRTSFRDKMFSTMMAYSYYNLAKNEYWRHLAIGGQFNIPNLTIQYDFKYSNEDLDKTSVVSSLVNEGVRVQNTEYIENWMRAEYFLYPRWSVTIMGTSSTSYWKQNSNKYNKIRSLYSFTGALEYHLSKTYNVKLFAAYVGRYSKNNQYFKEQFGLENNTTELILFGLVSPLKLF